jgi:hypothetical protein
MRAFRYLFGVAAIAAIGIVSFAGLPNEVDALTDMQAAQIPGGGCTYFTQNTCAAPCSGSCKAFAANSTSFGGSSATGNPCGGNSTCETVWTPMGCLTVTTTAVPPS